MLTLIGWFILISAIILLVAYVIQILACVADYFFTKRDAFVVRRNARSWKMTDEEMNRRLQRYYSNKA